MTLRQHRMTQGMTIRDLARSAGLSTQTIVAIEKGKPARMQSYKKLAGALNVDLMDIKEYRGLVFSDQNERHTGTKTPTE